VHVYCEYWPEAHDIATQRSPYYDGCMISGATGEPTTPGYAFAQMRYAGKYCAYLVACGKIDMFIDAAFGAARESRERGARGGARDARH